MSVRLINTGVNKWLQQKNLLIKRAKDFLQEDRTNKEFGRLVFNIIARQILPFNLMMASFRNKNIHGSGLTKVCLSIQKFVVKI